jgi:enterochelin esterase-like enzyme
LEFSANKWQNPSEIDLKRHVTGIVQYHPQMHFPGLKPRDIIVWLPPGYMISQSKRYPVLYMHDGQNTMNPQTSFLGMEWHADEVADSLISSGKIQPLIIVAIYNTSDRTLEYSDSDKGVQYQKFLIEYLKPFIDSNYRTLGDARNTAIMGSSMGGLASFLLSYKNPHIFGKAACMSPALIAPYLSILDSLRNDSSKKNIKIYLDNGTAGLEEKLMPGCEEMVRILKNKGYHAGQDFEWFADQGAPHNEMAWSKRLWRPLQFLFPKE